MALREQAKMAGIEATFKVVTPMFMSGAEQSQAELRLPSIKGALRFWWRALAWGRLNGDLAEIRRQENALFGSTATGQAAVLMKLHPYQVETHELKSNKKDRVLYDRDNVIGDGARYLGYGVMHAFTSRDRHTQEVKNYEGELIRPCLLAPFTFRVSMMCKLSVQEEQVTQLKEAIQLFGLIGGLGSRARKGYGSVMLMRLEHNGEVWQPPEKLDGVKQVLETFKAASSHIDQQPPPYTALSANSRFVLIEGNHNESALSLLSRIGREQVFYRSWGKNGKVLQRPREENFKEDHDLMKNIPTRIDYPKRIAFGLPHNYGKSKHLHVTPSNHDRRSSPLFLHIHQHNQHPPIAILSFLPAVFLPEGESIILFNTPEPFQENTTFWQPVTDFLERLKGEHQQKPLKRSESFAQVVEV